MQMKHAVMIMTAVGLLLIYFGLLQLGLQHAKPFTILVLSMIAGWQVGGWVGTVAIWLSNKLE